MHRFLLAAAVAFVSLGHAAVGQVPTSQVPPTGQAVIPEIIAPPAALSAPGGTPDGPLSVIYRNDAGSAQGSANAAMTYLPPVVIEPRTIRAFTQ